MKKIVLLFAALSLFAAACSSNTTVDTATIADDVEDADTGGESSDTAESTSETDGDEDDPSTTQEEEATAVPEPTTVPEPAATEVPPTPEPAVVSPAFESAVRAVIDADDWCAAAAAAEAGMLPLDTLNFTDPVEVEQGMRQSLAVVTASLRLVPSAIASDVAVTVEGFTALITELEAVEWVFFDIDQAFLQTFDGPQELAAYNIEKYNFEQCGIGADPGAPPSGDTTAGIDDGEILEGTIRDEVIAQFLEVGFSPDEANCILDNIDFAAIESLSDPTILLGVFEQCGIPLERLAGLGG